MPTPSMAQNPTLPPPFDTSTPTSLTPITQGAEALLYRTHFLTPSIEVALKIRPPKPYRHPTLDKRLTRQRILAEARVLVKLRRQGVPVPKVYSVDWENGWIAVEWIEGRTVKECIQQRNTGDMEGLRALLGRIGECVGRLHERGVVHGDLTTSNLMVRQPQTSDLTTAGEDGKTCTSLEGEIVLIDFGLAMQSTQEEERAVDLYVLERAFGSTHPKEEGEFGVVLEAYRKNHKGAKQALRRLEDVRMRGRKKSMIG